MRMRYRFYDDAGRQLEDDELEDALRDHEREVGMVAFAREFPSMSPYDITSPDEAAALARLFRGRYEDARP